MSVGHVGRFCSGVPSRCTRYEVHGGFVHAFDSVAKWVQERIDEDGCTADELVWTGHSLGGAMATVAWAHHGGAVHWYGRAGLSPARP